MFVFCLAVTVTEDPVFTAWSEPRTVLWRLFAKCQSDWKRHHWPFLSGKEQVILTINRCMEYKLCTEMLSSW